jgi:RimJ/RimL family protein N-acetyltransferase
MPTLIYARSPDMTARLAGWVAERIPHVGAVGFGPCAAIGVATERRMLAGIVFHEWQEQARTIQLSFAAASPIWARPAIIRALLAYPFLQVGAFKVWTATPAENEPALAVNRRLGFKREAILAHHFGKGRHAVIMRMLRPRFDRLYGGPDGQGFKLRAAAA